MERAEPATVPLLSPLAELRLPNEPSRDFGKPTRAYGTVGPTLNFLRIGAILVPNTLERLRCHLIRRSKVRRFRAEEF